MVSFYQWRSESRRDQMTCQRPQQDKALERGLVHRRFRFSVLTINHRSKMKHMIIDFFWQIGSHEPEASKWAILILPIINVHSK